MLVIGFIKLRKFLLIPTLLWVIKNECWILSNAFSVFTKMTHCLDWFSDAKPTFTFLGQTSLAHSLHSFYTLLDSVCLTFVKNFCIYIHVGHWSLVFFLRMSLSHFGGRIMLASSNELGSIHSLIFWKSSWRSGISSWKCSTDFKINLLGIDFVSWKHLYKQIQFL